MKQKGKEAFEDYYRNVCNSESEYEALLLALKTKPLPVLRFRAENEDRLKKMWRREGLEWKVLGWYPLAIMWPGSVKLGEKLPGYDERWIFPMSATSLLPVLAMNLEREDMVLDTCAAPGGKAVMIAEKLTSPRQLVANDLSPARSTRMRRVFGEYGVNEVVSMTGPAERLWKKMAIKFDKVLVDAPCSSEAHVYRSFEHLKKWRVNRVKNLAQRQIKMLSTVISLVKPGGRLVYSTCAVTPEENEMVVDKICKKFGDKLELIEAIGDNLPGEAGRVEERISFKRSLVRRVWPVEGKLEPMFVAAWLRKVD